VPLLPSEPEDTFGYVERTLYFSPDAERQSDSIEPAETVSCATLDFLQAKYDKALLEFNESAKRFRARSGSPAAKNVRLLNRTQVKAEAARRALRNHIIDHACC